MSCFLVIQAATCQENYIIEKVLIYSSILSCFCFHFLLVPFEKSALLERTSLLDVPWLLLTCGLFDFTYLHKKNNFLMWPL